MKTWYYLKKIGVRRQEKVSFNNQCLSINNINKIIDIISYSLVQFVNEYLQTNWSKLAQKELDIPEEIKQ